MHNATKRPEFEIPMKPGLPKGRVAETAGVSVWTVHRIWAVTETRSTEGGWNR